MHTYIHTNAARKHPSTAQDGRTLCGILPELAGVVCLHPGLHRQQRKQAVLARQIMQMMLCNMVGQAGAVWLPWSCIPQPYFYISCTMYMAILTCVFMYAHASVRVYMIISTTCEGAASLYGVGRRLCPWCTVITMSQWCMHASVSFSVRGFNQWNKRIFALTRQLDAWSFSIRLKNSVLIPLIFNSIAGQKERKESTQNTTITKRKELYYWSKWKRRNYSKYNRYPKCCVCKL